MGFKAAVSAGFENYANFRGRASRGEYWWFSVFTAIVLVALPLIDAFVTGGLIAGLVGLGLLVPTVSVLVRRLHDGDRSGWWIAIALVPLVGLIALLVFLVSRGTDGPNRFGEPRVAKA